MKSLLRRIERIEDFSRPADDETITIRCVHLKALPRDYTGEKHEVLVKGWPYQQGTGGECELEERPGPGPALDFGFNGRLILIRYVSFPEDEDATEDKEGGKAIYARQSTQSRFNAGRELWQVM
jgi:hypothetical protein